MIPGEHQVARISADPDDDKYVVAAIEGRAALVVSGDPNLLDIGEYQGIRFFTPLRVPGPSGRTLVRALCFRKHAVAVT